MSVDVALVQSIESQPAALEGRLTTAMRTVGRRIVEKPEIVRALAAADGIPIGLVVVTEEQAVELADRMAQVIEGDHELANACREPLRIVEQMKQALVAAIGPEKGRLVAAKAAGNNARVAWQAELRRRAAKAEADRQASARAAAEQAAAVSGEDVPVAEVAPVVVPRTVSGGVAKSGTSVRVEPGEIVDFAQVPQEWLALVPAIARAVFLSDEMQGKVKRAAPGENVVWRGIRFTSVEHATNRR